MKEEMKQDVRLIVKMKFSMFMENDDAEKTTDMVLNDVVKDIDETADEEFNSSDVDMALSRVVRKCITEHYEPEDHE